MALRRATGRNLSLRARLLVVLAALVAVGLMASDVATYAALRSFLVGRVDDQLDSAVRPAVRLAGASRRDLGAAQRAAQAIPPGVFLEIRDGDGTALVTVFARSRAEDLSPPRLPAPADHAPFDPNAVPQTRRLETRSEDGTVGYRVSLTALGDGSTIALAYPLSSVNATLSHLLWIELVVTLAAVTGAGLAGLWLVRLGLRPLSDIEVTASQIAAGDLTARVPNAGASTEVGRLSLALNTMLARVEAAFAERRASEERLRRFVADASHELRTPLTSIRGYAELFRRGAASDPNELARAMKRIEDEATRMGIMVDDLLLLARLDQGRPLELGPVDLAVLAADAVADARAVEPDRPIDLDAPAPVNVLGDDARLRQVVGNLLANVRTHTPAGTPARVSVGVTPEGRAHLTVQDEGPGLPVDQASRAFERFYRADPSRNRASGGAGLGLAIVAAIAEAHGGRAWLQSTPGRGATFAVDLPLAPTARPAALSVP